MKSDATDCEPLRAPPAKPCASCPFLRTSMRGYLGAHTVEEFTDRFTFDTVMECHKSVDYEREDKTYLKQIQDGDARYCAGALIMMSNQLKKSRDPSRPVMEADKEAVFTGTREFVAHHTRDET